MEGIRKIVSNELSTKISAKYAVAYEGEIFKLCLKIWKKPVNWRDQEFVNLVTKIEYEKLGMLMTANGKGGRRKVLKDIHSKRLGWKSSSYETIRFEVSNEIDRETRSMEVAEGVFKCYKCSSYKTTSVGIQTRSADEPMTNFITCVNCGNKWKC